MTSSRQLTALVVDDSTTSRHRMATLLQLAGYQVYEATDPAAGLLAAVRMSPDLVVAEVRMRGGNGFALLQHLRRTGSGSRFLLMTTRPTARVQAQAAAAGVTCLTKPVHPRDLVDFLRSRTTGPAAEEPPARMRVTAERLSTPRPAAAPHQDEDEDGPSWQDRRREFLLSALPHHLAWIAASAKAGDAAAVAAAANTLATESGQHGHPEVARVCHTIVADAEKGVVSQPRLMQLVTLASMARS